MRIERVHPWLNPRTGVLEWRVDPPDVQAMDAGTPTYVISAYRWYSASTGTTVNDQTGLVAEDTALQVGTGQDVAFATAVNIRLQYDETNLGDPVGYSHTVQYRINGGTWTTPGAATTGVRSAADTVWTDGDSTTKQLTNTPSGSFTFGVGYDSAGTYGSNSPNIAQDDYGEYVACVQFIEADFVDGQEVEFGILNSGTGTVVGTDNVTATGAAEINIAAAVEKAPFTRKMNQYTTVRM